jgi:hypothetical protein
MGYVPLFAKWFKGGSSHFIAKKIFDLWEAKNLALGQSFK